MFHVLGERPFHTDGDLLALAFAPDASLWSVEEPGILRHWQLGSRKMLDWQLLSELEMLWAFSDDATLLASGSDDLTLWDVGDGHLVTVLEQPSWVTAVAFSPDSSLLASGHDDGVVRLWSVRNRRLLRELREHERPISALAFSADSTRLASAGEDRRIHLWQTSGELTGSLLGHTDRIPALAWHPQGHRLYSAGWDTTARVWDLATGEPIILLNSHAAQVLTLAIAPGGRLLACADSTNAIHIWDLNTHQTLHVLRKHAGEVRCLAFSPDGQQLASGGCDHVIHLWGSLDQRDPAAEQSASTGEVRGPITSKVFGTAGVEPAAPANEVRNGVALSPDGTHLASIDGTSGLRVWDTTEMRSVLDDPNTGQLFALAYSPDGRWIAGGGDSVVHLWDASSGRRQSFEDGQPLPITALSFTPDGAVLASASASGLDVWLWNTNTGQPILLIPEAVDNCSVEALAFHPDGRLLAVGGIDWLATGGSDGVVMIWDVVTRCPAAGWVGGVRSVAFHPSGQQLACASLQQTIRIYDALAERLVFELIGHEDMVNCVAYSPDGSCLASGGADRTVRLWDADTGRPLARMELDTQVKSLSFSPDGRYLFTGNANTSCYQLDVHCMVEEGV